MRTESDTKAAGSPAGPYGRLMRRGAAVFGTPWAAVAVVVLIVVALGLQFMADPSRAVPAFDTAYYQWRVEYLMANDPGSMIELRGAMGSLAGGYRVAEPVLGALLRTVGGVAAGTPTIVLSVLFRALAAVGVAAFAWRRRRSWGLFYVTLLTIPALFLLQRFFGYLDNFFTLSLLAGVLVLLEPVRTNWPARVMATMLMFLGGLSHPTTLAIFLLAIGAVALYRLVRERSLRAVLRSEGPVLVSAGVAVVLTAAFWLGGLWGPTSSFSDAAVPPPETLGFFVDRSIGVLKNLQPFDQTAAPALMVWGGVAVLIGLMAWGLVHLLVRAWRDREPFAEVTVAWTLPLAGMFGFLIGAAYPYFRFFNATLAPLLLVAVGLALLVAASRRVPGPVAPALAVVVVAVQLSAWWARGLSAWNAADTWLTPQVRQTTAAISGYLNAVPEGTRAVVVADAQPDLLPAAGNPYSSYKSFANATYGGIEGEQIPSTTVFFGRVEDLAARRASTANDQPYSRIARETSQETFEVLDGGDPVAVFAPVLFNNASTNADFLEGCDASECVRVIEGLYLLPAISVEPDGSAIDAGREAAAEARSAAAAPPGPFEGLGGTLLALLRLGLLFLVPGFLLWRLLPGRTWVDGLALVPLLSIAAATTAGVVLVAVLRQPFGAGVGWASWGIAVGVGLLGTLAGLRRRRAAATG